MGIKLDKRVMKQVQEVRDRQQWRNLGTGLVRQAPQYLNMYLNAQARTRAGEARASAVKRDNYEFDTARQDRVDAATVAHGRRMELAEFGQLSSAARRAGGGGSGSLASSLEAPNTLSDEQLGELGIERWQAQNMTSAQIGQLINYRAQRGGSASPASGGQVDSNQGRLLMGKMVDQELKFRNLAAEQTDSTRAQILRDKADAISREAGNIWPAVKSQYRSVAQPPEAAQGVPGYSTSYGPPGVGQYSIDYKGSAPPAAPPQQVAPTPAGPVGRPVADDMPAFLQEFQLWTPEEQQLFFEKARVEGYDLTPFGV